MGVVNLRLEKDIVKGIDYNLKKFRYNNRTDFIRQAIRDKLVKLEEEVIKNS